MVREITREMFSSVEAGRCPHCTKRTPRIRKDGGTKFFKLPLSDKDTKFMKDNHGYIEKHIIYEEEFDTLTEGKKEPP
jgi:hypothetical protein